MDPTPTTAPPPPPQFRQPRREEAPDPSPAWCGCSVGPTPRDLAELWGNRLAPG